MFDLDDGALQQRRDGSPAPRVFLGFTTDGPRWWFRRGLDLEVTSRLETLLSSIPAGLGPQGPSVFREPILRLVGKEAPPTKVWEGPAYVISPDSDPDQDLVEVTTSNLAVLESRLPEWLEDVEAGRPMCALLVDGTAVSLCCSAEVGSTAHEAGVETHPDFRGRGFAGRVSRGWARLLGTRGLTPLYSTSWDNKASIAVAQKLRLRQYASTLHVT